MPAATRRRPKPAEPKQPGDELLAEGIALHLAAYREFVARAAAGERIFGDELDRVTTLLHQLGLPGFAWQRDVHAARQYRNLERQLVESQLPKPDDPRDAALLTKELEGIRRRLGEAEERLRDASHPAGLQARLRHRQSELHLNHPHLFGSVAAAVELRMPAARRRAAEQATKG